MALRRASLSMLKALQVHSANVGVRPAAACMQISTAAPVSESGRSGRDALERTAYYGRNFTQQLHSFHESKNDEHEAFHHESSKMTAEGGGAEEKTFHEKAEDILRTNKEKLIGSDDATGKAEEAADAVKDKASKEADTAKDVAKGLPEQASETATELKEVGIEAGKAVARDAAKVAEKVGLTSDAGKATETVTELKEVGQEAGKAAIRDSKKVAEKVGLK